MPPRSCLPGSGAEVILRQATRLPGRVMTSPCQPVTVAVAAILTAVPLLAQQWVPPDASCSVPGSHYLFRSASLYLKQAAETAHPEERDRFFGEAARVLAEALGNAELGQSPTPWYYLGRLYAARHDVTGADSAFTRAESLEPDCRDDIARWRKELVPHALYSAALAWQGQQVDSAVRLLKLIERLDPKDASGKIELTRIYVERGHLDSADVQRRAASAMAITDTAAVRHLRDAHYQIIRSYRQRVLTEPAEARSGVTRRQLDEVHARIADDSTVLAAMNADVAKIRASGARLNAASLHAFQAESTTRSNRLVDGRAERDSLAKAATADSASIERVLAPAIDAYEEFLEGGMRIDAAAELAALYAVRGNRTAVDGITERIVGAASDASENALFLAGSSLLSAGQAAPAARLLAAGLVKNPYHRNGLSLLARAQIERGAPDSGLIVGRRLVEVDPLNDQPFRLLALAWDRMGHTDSARAYQDFAESGLTTLVTVTQFAVLDSGASFGATVRNRGSSPTPPMVLRVEFLSDDGTVVLSQDLEVPDLGPGAYQAVSARGTGQGIVAWRYRPL